MGWIFTWFAWVWIVLGVINIYANRFVKDSHAGHPMSIANLTRYQYLQHDQSDTPERRWSDDSGNGTERNSSSLFGAGSPGAEPEPRPFEEPLPMYNTGDFDDERGELEKRGFLQNTRVDRFLSRNIYRVSAKFLIASKVIYTVFERTLVVLGFVAALTGLVTLSGIFVSFIIDQSQPSAT
jgi:hypothetical protein